MKTLKIALLLLFTFAGTLGMAQKKDRAANRMAKADSILTVRLALTEAEQKAFLPVYHEYVAAKKANRKKHLPSKKKGKKKMDELSDAELEKIIQQRFDFTQADLNIKKAYHEKFKKVLSMKKLAKFYQVEKRMFQRKTAKKNKKARRPAR